MRRISFIIVVTAAILVLLFSYRTSTSGSLATSSVAAKAHVVTNSAAGVTTPTTAPSTPVATATSTAQPDAASATSAQQLSTPSTSAPKATSTATTAASSAGPLVIDGDSEMTRYGVVQVEVTITAGKITDVQAIQYPTESPRDQEINADAIPQLHDQVLAAQSAQIDGVSGATYTTQGYATSLQSALDAANFK